MNSIRSRVDSEMDNVISDLQTLIRQPSISTTNEGIIECSKLIVNLMSKAGIDSEILYLEYKNKDVPPIVYGEVKSKSNPNGKTILFYNHYDVQPAEPLDLWKDDPFSGKVEGNYVFGRGASDDKGELITRIKAIEYFLKETGDVPCNVKFVIEGEEESGSPNIEKYLISYKDRLRGCHGVIWESGMIDEKDRPVIKLGVKGVLSIDLIAKGPPTDLHSSLAVLIENPVWMLINALHTMRDEKGNILINDWYQDAREFTDEEIELIKSEPFDVQEFKRGCGVNKIINNLNDYEAKKALAGATTCNITGLSSGYTGQGIKNVIPATAVAKMDFRLIPDMMPQKQFELIKRHLKESGFDDIDVNFIDGEPASRIPVNHPLVKPVMESAKEVFGDAVLSVSSAGAGPMYYFHKILNAPCIYVGGTYVYAGIHSPNEYARIDLLNKTIKWIGSILERFAQTDRRQIN